MFIHILILLVDFCRLDSLEMKFLDESVYTYSILIYTTVCAVINSSVMSNSLQTHGL